MKISINKRNIITSAILSIIVSITSFLIATNYLVIAYPKLELIQNIIFIPIWLLQIFFTYLYHIFPFLGYIGDDLIYGLFLTLFYPIIFVFWFFVFLLYFKICDTYFKKIQKRIAYLIPFIFIIIIVMLTMLVYLNSDNLSTESCLSGEYSRILGVSGQGAMFCFKSLILDQKLALVYNEHPVAPTEMAYQDTIKFCANLSNKKLAAINKEETMAPNTTYRDYCFIRLANLMASNILREETRDVKTEELEKKYNEIENDHNSVYWNIIRKVCSESGKSSGLQKEQECINYFNQYKTKN